jgi:DNA-binding CsgD family transcriptional regulator
MWYEPPKDVAICRWRIAASRTGGGVEDGVVVHGNGVGAPGSGAAPDEVAVPGSGAVPGEVAVLGRSLLARCLPAALRDLGIAAAHREVAGIAPGVAVLVVAGPLDAAGELPEGVPVVVVARASRDGSAGAAEPAQGARVDDLAGLAAAITRARTDPSPAGPSRPARARAASDRGTARDPSSLTEREREVFALLERGRSAAAIAAALGISVHTARTHVQNILRKLGVGSRLEAIAVHDLRQRQG